jgi:hypothetical protein
MRMKKSIWTVRCKGLIFCCCLFFNQLSGQAVSVMGAVREPDGKGVASVNVLLMRSSDSALLKGMITDTVGNYFFEDVGRGKYYILASFAGMAEAFSKTFEVNSDTDQVNLGILYLRRPGGQLKEITITGNKPLFEQQVDRMIIHVGKSITTAGGTALDVLERSPGVSVNRQDNSIALNGKNGVSVMINGKITYMPADALVQFLGGIPAASIEKIELITTPPSKYDAAGNGGYINIVLIQNPNAGFSGSYFLTGGYGKKESGAAGIHFDYRKGKINLYGNYSFNHDTYIQPSTGFVAFTRAGNHITDSTFSKRDAKTDVQNARIGIDYQVDTTTLISALLSGYNSRWRMIAHNGATISRNGVADTVISSVDDPETNLWQNLWANLNFQHLFKPGKALIFDANMIYYKDNNPNNYSTDYYDGQKLFLYHEDSRSVKLTPIHFRVFSSDYTTSLGKRIGVETGVKLSLSRFNNDVRVENLRQGTWIPDSVLTADYFLKENIWAAYTSFSVSPDPGISIKAGLRYEYTVSELGSIGVANIVNRKYGGFFPTFVISKKLRETNSVSFSYSRRITRPAFNDLAPFTVFFDPKTFYSGNPALQPAIANAIQANYVNRNTSFTISYTHESHTIDNSYFQTQRLDTISNILYLSARNFNYENYLTVSISLPFRVTSWWNMQNNIIANWRRINTESGGQPLELERVDYRFNSTQRLLLPGGISFEVTGSYTSESYLGTAKTKAIYQLDAGLQKKLGEKGDILRVAGNDIFNSGNDYQFAETEAGTGATVNRRFNFGTMACRITYIHYFGSHAMKGHEERSRGAEEELKRVHN